MLREKLTPHFRLGCKRVLLSNDYYRALAQPNVDVATDAIVEVVPEGIVTRSPAGERVVHPVDAIIFGTGFHVTDVPIAAKLVGKDGRSLREHWDESGMSALHGATVAGFPNLFLLVGPNTGLGHNSIIFMIESQLTYVLGALRAMEQSGAATLEPRPQSAGRLQRRDPGAAARNGLEHRRLLELVPRRARAATRRCGRLSPSASAISCAGSVPPTTNSQFGAAPSEASQDDEGLGSSTDSPAKVPARSS